MNTSEPSKFGRWTILEWTGPMGGKARCRCDCGNEKVVDRWVLKAGHSRSCGCLKIEAVRATGNKHRKHGMEGTTEYRIWVDMRRRCHDPRRPDFKNYGARGITVCDEWRTSFEAFFRDMGHRPEGTTLDRLNNSGRYCKSNCVWAARKVQERNKRTTRIVEVNGQRMSLAEAVERSGLKYYTVLNRISTLGWPLDRALKTPVTPR